ncbi:MAG TPA: alpha/beta fold hydrolase, partial [Steroidobacteraceae bacterium]|nr:alpha/beta fold hydrolase [Steroidobacteraceae bacterium]
MGAKRGNRTRRAKSKAAAQQGPAPSDVELPSAAGFAPPDAASEPELPHEAANEAAEQILGANPLIGIDRREMLDAAQRLVRMIALEPQVVLGEHLRLARELFNVLTGSSEIAPERGDRRFSHDIWQKSGYFKRLMQGFLAWRATMNRILDRANASDEDRERARFVLSLFTEAFAPTNSLLGNPGAIQRIVQTRGKSLVYGAQNFVDDLLNNGGMPQQVDQRKFRVGKNVANSPGVVVHRSEVFELIQYEPATEKVYARPLLVVPPQINKFYVLDLAPGRSFAEYATQHGVQLFCISWRNPTAAQRDWNLETYLRACRDAIDTALEITDADQIHTMAACAGGFTLTTLLGHLAARGDKRVASATLLVTVLDTEAPTMLGQFASKTGVAAAIQKSRKDGVLEGRDMARIFSWLRPNDLVWLFVANNWVMGNRPPAFDILYWNSDTTRLPAEFHGDLLRIFLDNSLKHPNRLEVLGTKIDMSKVKTPTYVIAGITDHITPWDACYQSREILKGPMQFVLSSSGHIQSIVNPPSNPKAKYYLNPDLSLPADEWLA